MSSRPVLVSVLAALLLVAVVVGGAWGIATSAPAVPASAAPPALLPGSTATARTPAWAELVTDLDATVQPGAANVCVAGEPACLEAVIAEMEARFEDLGCSHAAPFAFTYLETTRGVEEHVARPGFFDDPAEIVNLDAVFAAQYFDAIDHWQAGEVTAVPPAWQVAFLVADQRTASAAVDIMLGMNAHISRDLAFAVAAQLAGLPDPRAHDPTDFVRIDEVIAVVQQPMLSGAAARFDPALDSLLETLVPADARLDSTAVIGQWRAEAYEFGVRLAMASDEAARAAVAAEIERTAFASAVLILNLGASGELGLPTAPREQHCTEHRARR